jgi:ATP synthase protein I
MPFHRPLPDSDNRSKMSSGVSAIVQAEKGIQIALLIPSSVAICWIIGAWADKHFHQTWIAIAGIVFGAVSGLVYIFRMAIQSDRSSRNDNGPQSGAGKGPSELPQ